MNIIKKRAQISIFLVIGIIILLVGAFILQGIGDESRIEPAIAEEIIDTKLDIPPIKVFTENCMQKITKEGLIHIGRQGGYYNLSLIPGIIFSIEQVPYYYLDKTELIPSKETIEKELSDYIKNEIPDCIGNYDPFMEQGHEIEYSIEEVSTLITKESVIVSATIPSLIGSKTSQTEVSDYNIRIKTDLFNILEISKEIVAQYDQWGDKICLTCLDEISDKYGLDIKMLPVFDPSIFHNDIYWVFIHDKGHDNYSFRYVLEMIVPATHEKNISINLTGNHTAIFGQAFTFQVNASGESLQFSDDSDLFDIGPDSGIIQFTPQIQDAGIHFIKIEVTDPEDNYDYDYLSLTIKDIGEEG